MPSNRTDEVGGVWANGAADVPAEPISGTTYKNSTLTEAQIEAAWKFANTVGSAQMNEVMYRLTLLMQLIEDWGIMPYSALTDYAINGQVMGSNGKIYRAIQANGPATATKDPVSEPTYWTDVTVETHAAIDASTTVKGHIEIATDAEADSGVSEVLAVNPKQLQDTVGFTTSFLEDGYTIFPDGLILQWGVHPSPGTGVTAEVVTLPLTFPTGVFMVLGWVAKALATGEDVQSNSAWKNGVSLSSIQVTTDVSTATGWIAIGY